ncbi:MAG: hypothetical protein Aurels2KO_16900 [Aureliella sp.]
MNLTPRSRAKSPGMRLALLGPALLAALFSGCNSLGSGKLAEQLREENERLISEFRAQRDTNEKLRKQNQMLEDRVAESEKLLARTLSKTDSRISSRPLPSTTPGQSSSPLSAPAASGIGDTGTAKLKWQPSTSSN